jgi:amidohydrolase
MNPFVSGSLALAATLFASSVMAQQALPLKEQVASRINGMYPSLEAVYKDLHAHPELAFQEVRTAAKLAAEMRAIGFDVTEKVGKTGIVAIYKNGPGPTIMVRTELDGLPMEEKTGLPYASKAQATLEGRSTFTAHSCGHDIHMTSWLATARALVAMKSQWKGSLMFVGQPAEEVVTGAKAMLDDGLFKRFAKPDVVFGLHSLPGAHGTVFFNTSTMTSNSNSFSIVFKGRGGHGAAPDKSIDPVMIASRFVVDVQTLISRERDPLEFGVVTVGAIHGGTVGNIIPDNVQINGTIRSFSPTVRTKLIEGVKRIANASAMMADAPAPEVTVLAGTSAVVNNEALTLKIEAVLKDALGAANVNRAPPLTASEDFSYFVNEGIPSMFFFVGIDDPKTVADAARPGGKPVVFNHSPYYAPVPEPTIKTAAQAMTLAVLHVLGR